MSKPRLLFSIPSRSHVGIAVDEMTGMRELGYECDGFSFAGREGADTGFARIHVILGNALNLIRKAYQFKPDMIYFNSRLEVNPLIRDSFTIFLFRICYLRRVRFLIKSHGSDLEVIHDKSFIIKRLALPYLRKNIAAWLFLSSEEKNAVISTAYFRPGTVFTTKNIVRTGQFKPDHKFRLKLKVLPGDKILLFTGRVIREKGIFEVIDAFNRIRKSFPVKLIIVGDGSDYQEVLDQVVRLGLSDRVIFTGFIPEPEVVKFYANSDILVFPTYFPEGFPMALFNSLGAGLGIVTTPTRAAADFLTEPDNCLWAKGRDPDSVYEALYKLLSSEDLMTSMRENNIIKSRLFSRGQVSRELAITIGLIKDDQMDGKKLNYVRSIK